MNKYQKWLALLLIDLEIRKHERKALKRMRKQHPRTAKARLNKLYEMLQNGHEYRDLLWLRKNIESINNPWQGVFAGPYWRFASKDGTYVESFPPGRAAEKVETKNEFFDGLGYGIATDEEFEQWIASYEEAMENYDPKEFRKEVAAAERARI